MIEVPPRAPSDDKRWRAVDARMRRLGRDPGTLIEVLHAVQESFGFLDTESLIYVGESLGVPLSKVYGVAKPPGRSRRRRSYRAAVLRPSPTG